MTTVMVSGGFDPLHGGHIEYIRRASVLGREVIVALNSDEWLIDKKGFVFMPWAERAAVLDGLRWVNAVVAFDDSDGTACDAIRKYEPDIFANGGDRVESNTPEVLLCRELGIETVFEVGGGKTNSSSAIARKSVVQRQWGTYETLYEGAVKVKHLVVTPGAATSMQRHKHRSELWVFPDNCTEFHPAGAWHQLKNTGDVPLDVIEIQMGDYFGEDDIERR